MTLFAELERAAGMLVMSASLANNLDANIYAGRNNDRVEVPCVVCACESAETLIYGSGINRCNLVIQVQERAIDTDVTSSLGQTAFDAFNGAEAINKLISYSTSSIYVYELEVKDFRNNVGTTDKTWVQEMNLEVIAALL